ncbi:fatty acid desaturase, partial [Mesorhizobium sp. M1A.F.Ca.IN.022.07.1.1]
MDHRDVIASLTNEERSRLTGKSDLPGIIQFAVHLGAIVALGALIAAKVPYWP